MLPNSLKLALRHFSRKQIYSAVIVLSLTVGFTCTCLLVSFLIAETSADSFHSSKDRIFQMSSTDPFAGSGRLAYILKSASDYFADGYPDVEDRCQINIVNNAQIEIGESINPVKLVEADPSLLKIFDFPMEAGAGEALTPDGLMISSKKAMQLFGRTDVLGQLVKVQTPDSSRTLAVTAVLGEMTEKSHLSFEAVVSTAAFRKPGNVGRGGGATYMLLQNPSNATDLMARLNADSLRPGMMGPGSMNYFLDPLEKSYFNTSNRMPFMQTRSETFVLSGWIVCALMLFMAAFNFINLFLLSMQERKKEQGIKKTLGISNRQLIGSLTMETSLYLVSSLALSLIIVYMLIPVFNHTLETDLAFGYLSNIRVMGTIGLSVFLLAMTAVLFSVRQQRSVLPVSMIRNTSSKVRFSKFFFTLQFFVSITISVCAVTIARQMNFLENEPLGFNRNIIQVNTPAKESRGRIAEFKNEVLQLPNVTHAAFSQGNPISGNMIARYELEDGSVFAPYLFAGDEDLVKTLHLEVIEGSIDLVNKDRRLVNETLVKHFGMKDPIGMKIPGTTHYIAGVVKDFTCASFKQEIPPAIMIVQPDTKALLIDYSEADLDNLLPQLQLVWSRIFPDDFFSYRVIQQDLMKKYAEETLFYKIVMASSAVSMLISCFGLFALSWAVTRSRAREMGIRKVLGATAIDILALLTLSFTRRLVIAFLLAAPLGYYLMDLWLSRFVNKIPIDAWIFVIAGAFLATITAVALSLQTVKASVSNPLDEIRE